MTVKAAIIAAYDDMSGSYTCSRLCSEARAEGISIETIGVLDSYLSDKGVVNRGKTVQDYDFIINRYKWGTIKDEIGKRAKKTYNDTDAFNKFVNKYNQYRCIRSEHFEVPASIMSNSTIDYGTLANSLGTPFVAKGLENSQGQEIFKISTEAEYEQLRSAFPAEKEWLFQEFVGTSVGRDLRVFSIRGKPVAAMIRENKNDFRSNYALGASLTPFDDLKSVEKITEDLYGQTHIDFAGIDLLFGENNYCFCEINVMPGIKGVESITGTNIAKQIIQTICGDLNG